MSTPRNSQSFLGSLYGAVMTAISPILSARDDDLPPTQTQVGSPPTPALVPTSPSSRKSAAKSREAVADQQPGPSSSQAQAQAPKQRNPPPRKVDQRGGGGGGGGRSSAHVDGLASAMTTTSVRQNIDRIKEKPARLRKAAIAAQEGAGGEDKSSDLKQNGSGAEPRRVSSRSSTAASAAVKPSAKATKGVVVGSQITRRSSSSSSSSAKPLAKSAATSDT